MVATVEGDAFLGTGGSLMPTIARHFFLTLTTPFVLFPVGVPFLKGDEMMQTVRRGTRRFTEVLENAHNVRVFSLHNSFRGVELKEGNPDLVCPPREHLAYELRTFNFAKLKDDGNGHYSVDVHSNLWYEFEV